MDADANVQVNGRRGSGGGVALRLFAALALSDEAARELAACAAAIAVREPDARPVDPGSLHVTFAFLGDVSEEYVPAVAAALDAAAFAVTGPAACSVRAAQPFGAGRVLGADVDIDLHALLDSARDTFLDAVAPYAPALDRRAWHPHVSLLRVPRDHALPSVTGDEAAALATTSWISSALRLYASLPAPGGTTYRELHAVPLGEPVLRD